MTIEIKCKTCQHSEINKINEMLISGVSSEKVAEMFHLKARGVRLHREKHLPKALVKAKTLQDQKAANQLIDRVEEIYTKAWDLMRQAEQNRKYQPAVGALKEARQCLELTGKLIGTLKTGTQINVNYNPQWIELRSTIFKVLEEYPEVRLKLAAELNKIEEVNFIEGEVIDHAN